MSVILSGIEDNSTIDWYGKSSTVLFFSGCNLRCGFCYNHQMMKKTDGRMYSFDEICYVLDMNLPFIDAVVLTGGEPTLQAHELISLCRIIKAKYDLDIMLDTNGTKPYIVEQMLKEGLIDRVALDIKSAFSESDYNEVTGILNHANPIHIYKTMMMCKKHGVELEARTTMIPNKNTGEWIISSIVKTLRNHVTLWYLQQFQPEESYDLEYRKIERPSRSMMLEYAAYARISGFEKPLYIKTIEKGLEEIPLKVSDLLQLEKL